MNSKAEKTIHLLTEALAKQSGIIGSESIQMIHKLSSKAFSISLPELADFIRNDVTLTAKVISAANTLEFNFTGRPVSTVSQAINLIGFNRIRSLTMSLLLIDSAERAHDPEEQREVVAIALTSGLAAQWITSKIGFEDPEQAFICASLRNYSRVLLSSIFLKEYREALRLSATKGEDAAFEEVFGIAPLPLSQQMLRNAKIPRIILQSLQKPPSRILMGEATSDNERLMLIADFSEKIADLTIGSNFSAKEFSKASEELCQHYEKALPIKSDEIKHVLSGVDRELRIFNNSYGFKSFLNPFLSIIQDRTQDRDPNIRKSMRSILFGNPSKDLLTPEDEYKDPAMEETKQLVEVALEHKVKKPKVYRPAKNTVNIIHNGILHITETLTEFPISLDKTYRIVSDTIWDALNLNDCLIFVQDPVWVKMVARYGRGDLFDIIREKPLLDLNYRDLFTLCIKRREDILISDSTDKRIHKLIPSWLQEYPGAKSFAVFPIENKQQVFALIFAACHSPNELRINAQIHNEIKALRIHLTTAKRLSQL